MTRDVGPRRQPLREVALNAVAHPHATLHKRSLPQAHKQAIVAKKFEHPELTPKEIGFQIPYLGQPVPRITVRRTLEQAYERSGGATDLPSLLRATARKQGSGRPRLIEPNSRISREIYQYIHGSEERENAPYTAVYDALPQVQETCSSRTLRRHCLEDLSQRQRIRGRKPSLKQENKDSRVEYSNWGLHELEDDAIFIFVDESMISLGVHGWNNTKATLDAGADANEHASQQPSWHDDNFMVWAAICKGYRPIYYIFEELSTLDIVANDQYQARCIQKVEDQQKEDKKQAKIPGTRQYLHYQAAIEAAYNKQIAEKKPIRRIPVKDVFTKDQYTQPPSRKDGGKGIDWIRYRNEVQIPLLFPFAEKVQAENPSRKVWIIEDNAPPHVGARRMSEEERRQRGVDHAPHPSNSPDLNEIEGFWGDTKKLLKSPDPDHSRGEAMRVCKDEYLYILANVDQEMVDRRCDHLEKALRRCRQHGGNNNYHG